MQQEVEALLALQQDDLKIREIEKQLRSLQGRLAQHKILQERNLHQLEDVKRMREATAATAQVESTRRLMAEDESELAILGRRMNEMNAAVAASKQALVAVEEEQQTARPEIEAKRSALQAQLDEARRDRDGRAGSVSRPMLGKYDRIRGKRTQALYALRGGSCGNCDTAVPLQRRNIMAGSGQIEVCEACGVLLYAEGA